MNYLLIENKGEIDVNALILMGGSTKRGSEGAIGFFGSGNKYAIALLLKNKIDFKIFSGNKKIEVTTRTVNFRDKSFDQILINGQETSLTTDMGPQWETWMAVREAVSNSIDEGSCNIVNSVEAIEGKEGHTRIYIEHTPEIKDVIDNWDNYFSFDRTDAIIDLSKGKVFPHIKGNGIILYRKGIQCHSSHSQVSLYQYDLPDFKINESRVVTNTHDCGILVQQYLAKYVTKEVAQLFLNFAHKSEYWENDFTWYDWNINTLSPVWREAIGTNVLIVENVAGWFQEEQAAHGHYFVTKDFATIIHKVFKDVTIYGLVSEGEKGIFKKVDHTPRMDFLLKKSLDFLKEGGYSVPYTIQIGNFNDEKQLGGVRPNTILLSTKVFDMGVKEVVMTIVEETEHLNTKFKDCSKEFQNHFIKLYITEMENRIGNFL